MSDDTPTQRFPEAGGLTPTEPISTGDVREDLQEEKQKSRGLLIGLIIAGVLLLVAIVVLVFFLVRGNGQPGTPGVIGTDSPAPAPSETPASTPTPQITEEEEPPPPPAPVVRIDDFTVDTGTVFCGKNGQPDDNELFFSWATSNGERVYFGINTNDASSAPFFDNLPLDGDTASNFPTGYAPFLYSCGNQSVKYTLTVVDGSGNKASTSVTVTDINFNN